MAAETATRRLVDWATLGGVAFVFLFVIGTLLLFDGTPMGDDPPSKVISYFSDGGDRDRISTAWVLAGVGYLFFLVFVAALRETVRRIDAEGILTTLTALGGGIYAALGLVAFSLEAGVRTMSDDTYQHRVYPEIIHAADDAAWMIHAAGGGALALMILAVSISFIRAATLPSFVGWVGRVAAVAALASIVFFPVFIWLLWLLIASVVLFSKGAPARDVHPA